MAALGTKNFWNGFAITFADNRNHNKKLLLILQKQFFC